VKRRRKIGDEIVRTTVRPRSRIAGPANLFLPLCIQRDRFSVLIHHRFWAFTPCLLPLLTEIEVEVKVNSTREVVLFPMPNITALLGSCPRTLRTSSCAHICSGSFVRLHHTLPEARKTFTLHCLYLGKRPMMLQYAHWL
jgi:hypothetical protein